jgi:hypothetical protein
VVVVVVEEVAVVVVVVVIKRISSTTPALENDHNDANRRLQLLQNKPVCDLNRKRLS